MDKKTEQQQQMHCLAGFADLTIPDKFTIYTPAAPMALMARDLA